MKKFRDRTEAGQILAQQLTHYKNNPHVLVLALPRGGVPVAYEIAAALHAPLDVFVVKKLGTPGYEELAMGAIAMGGALIFNEEILKNFNISKEVIQQTIKQKEQELKKAIETYRANRPLPQINNKIIILVDDGIATGATMQAAIKALYQQQPQKIVVAVPLAEVNTSKAIMRHVDEFVCPLQLENFMAVGNWYEDFSQVNDNEVYMLLQAANSQRGTS